MSLKDLLPRSLTRRDPFVDPDWPFGTLRRDLGRLFEDFPALGRGFFRGGDDGGFSPSVDLVETESEIKVTAEIPGMEEKDIEVTVNRESLTLRGTKKEEHEKEEKGAYFRECLYGKFERVIPLPAEVKTDQVVATYKNGVLTVTLPKTPEGKGRRVTVEGA